MNPSVTNNIPIPEFEISGEAGLAAFLEKGYTHEQLQTTLKLVEDFIACEGAYERIYTPLAYWVRLRQLHGYLLSLARAAATQRNEEGLLDE